VRPRSVQDRHYLVTGPTGARPLAASLLLRRIRGRWGIENRHFHVKDRTFDEDRSQARCGTASRTLLRTLATTVLSLVPLTGKRRAYAPEKRIVLAASPMRAAKLLMQSLA
jgi:hypothetical protein